MRHLRTSAGPEARTVFAVLLLLAISVVGVSTSTSNTPAAFASGTACIDGTWTYDGVSSPPSCSRTFQYIDGTSTDSFTVPGGVTELDVELFGGKASNGDGEQGDTGWVGKVAGTVAVTAGDTVVVAVGGDAPQSSSYVYTNAAGQNPLEGYDGGYRGEKGPSGSSRVGQSGGAASVLLVQRDSSTVATIVAGGAGGGGGGNGSGGSGQTGLRSTTPVGRADRPTATTPTNGREGRLPGYTDGAGGGGGGGGATGGETYSCTAWDCNGLGGSAGLNGVDNLATTAANTYVDPTATSSQITITYEIPFTATVTPATSPVAGTEVTFEVEFNFAIDPATLTVADFTLGSGAGAATGCSVTAVTGTGTAYSITVGGCSSEGTVTPSLSANAVTVSNDPSVPAALQGINGPASPIDGTPAAIDNTAPSAPTLSMLAGSGGPSLSTGGVTVQDGVEFSAGPSSTDASAITYSCSLDGGSAQSPCPASFTGLTAGDHSLEVTATDAAGNATSTTFNWTQAGPPVPSLASSSDTGASDSDLETSDTTPSIELDGLVDGTTVTLRAQSTGQTDVTCTFTVSPSVRSCELDLPADGTWAVDSKVTDTQGEDSGWSSPPLAIELDSTAPAAPAGVDLAAASDTGASDTDDVTGDPTPRIEVAGGSAGDLVTVTATPVGSGGAVSCTFVVGSDTGCDLPELADGDWSVSSRFTDPAGNESAASPALDLSIDATAPANTAPSLDASSDSGSGDSDGITSDVTPLAELGGLTAGDVVTITATPSGGGSPVTCTFTATSDTGRCELLTLSEGEWSLSAEITDTSGNTTQTDSTSLTVDTTAPSAPAGPDLLAASDLGTSDADDLTSDTTPTISGGGSVGDTVTITATPSGGGSAVTCSYVVSATVTACDLPELADGDWEIESTLTDAAGNQSAAGPSLPVSIDGTADSALGLPAFAADADPTLFTDDGYAAIDTFVVVVPGTAGGDEVTLTATGPDGTVVTCTFTASASVTGCELGPLDDADWSIVATRADVAGNVSPASPAFTVGVREGEPAVPGVNVSVEGDAVDVTLTGPLSGDTVDVSGANGTSTVPCSFTVSASSTGCTLDGLSDGLWSVSATVTDPFGRQSESDPIQVAIPVAGISAEDACLGTPAVLIDGQCQLWSQRLSGDAFQMTSTVTDSAGNRPWVRVTSTDPTAHVTVAGIRALPGTTLTVSGSGFVPGSSLSVRASSRGPVLAEVTVAADGTWSIAVTVPNDESLVGSTLLVEWTDASSGLLTQLGIGRVVDVSMLPSTGGADQTAIVILMLAVGGLAWLVSKRQSVSV